MAKGIYIVESSVLPQNKRFNDLPDKDIIKLSCMVYYDLDTFLDDYKNDKSFLETRITNGNLYARII